MAGLRDIKRRITSVKSTQKITRAMRMVAAAKLRRAQESIEKARPYAYHMRDLVHRIALRSGEGAHPLLQPPSQGRVNLIAVTGDRGLCGAFNANVINEALRLIREDFPDREVEVTAVGRKGIEGLRRRNAPLGETHRNVMDDPLRSAVQLIDAQVDSVLKGEASEVYCLYHEFKSAISQKLTFEKLLPFEPEPTDTIPVDYIYEPDQETLITKLIARHLHVQMHRILYESAASEHGARMTAMESATNNASDMIERLTLQYNRARQSAITTEVIEIVSGAEAL